MQPKDRNRPGWVTYLSIGIAFVLLGIMWLTGGTLGPGAGFILLGIGVCLYSARVKRTTRTGSAPPS